MKDPVHVAEAAHDSPENSKVYEGYKEEALASIVDDLMAGEKANGWTLHDYLECDIEPWLPGIVAAAIISGDFVKFKDEIELKLRNVLEDSDAVSDRCWELDEAERERAKERE